MTMYRISSLKTQTTYGQENHIHYCLLSGDTMDQYLAELRSALQPLVAEFSLEEVMSEETSTVTTTRLANSTTGLSVEVNWQELRVFVTLFQLTPRIDFAKAVDLCQPVGGQRYGFDADYLLQLRQAEDSPVGGRLSRKVPGEIGRVIGRYEKSLAVAARDVLFGDFSVFRDLEALVAARSGAAPS